MMKNFFLATSLLALCCFQQVCAQDPLFTHIWFAQVQQLSPQYEIIHPLSPTVAYFKKNNRYGLIGIDGKVLFQPEFDNVFSCGPNFVFLQKDTQNIMASAIDGRRLSPETWAEVFYQQGWSDQYAGVRKGSTIYVFNPNGKVVKSIQANKIVWISDRAMAASIDRKVGIWNLNDEKAVAPQFEYAHPAPGGYWLVKRYDQSALLGPDLTLKTHFRYDKILPLKDGTFLATYSNSNMGWYKWFKADEQPKSDSAFFVTYEYSFIRYNMVLSADGEQCYLIDNEGNILNGSKAHIAKKPSEKHPGRGLLVETTIKNTLYDNGSYLSFQLGWYDEKRKINVAPKYKKVIVNDDKIYAVSTGKTEVFDRNNQLIQEFPHEVNLEESDFLWIYGKPNCVAGICDTNFNIIYQSAGCGNIQRRHWGGFAVNTNTGQNFFIDPAGRQLNDETPFTKTVDFSKRESYSPDGLKNLRSADGSKVVVSGYEYFHSFDEGEYFVVRKNGLWGFYSKDGEEIVPPRYDEINHATTGSIFIRMGKQKQIVDINTGQSILPPSYTNPQTLFNNLLLAKKDSFYTIFDAAGHAALDWKIDSQSYFNSYYLIKKGGKWGVTDFSTKVVEPFIYSKMTSRGHMLWAANDDGNVLLIPVDNGFKKVKLDDLRVEDCSQTRLFAGKTEGKWFIFDRYGEKVSEKSWDEILPVAFNGIIAIVRKDRQIFAVDSELHEKLIAGDADGLLDATSLYVRYSSRHQTILHSLENDVHYQIPDGKIELITNSYLVKIIGEDNTLIYSMALQLPPIKLLGYFYDNHLWGRIWVAGRQSTGWGILNDRGETVLPFDQKSISISEEYSSTSTYFLGERDETGFYDVHSGILLPALFRSFQWINNNRYLIVLKDDKYALFNDKAQPLTPFLYDAIDTLSGHVFWATKGDKIAILDKTGKDITPGPIDELYLNTNPGMSYVLFRKDTLTGIISRDGKILFPPVPYEFSILTENRFTLSDAQGEWSLYDLNGRKIVPGSYTEITLVGDNTFRVNKNGMKGILTADGKYTVPLRKGLLVCQEFGCLIKNGERYGVIDLKGKVLLNAQYDMIHFRGDSLIFIKNDKKTGIFNLKSKKWVLQPEYDFINKYAGGTLLPVRKGNLWGYVNHEGVFAIPLKFQYAEPFEPVGPENEKTAVMLHHQWFLINASGEIKDTLPANPSLVYKQFRASYPEITTLDIPTGITNDEGETVLPLVGYWLQPLVPGYMLYSKNGADPFGLKPPLGIINYAGKEITPPIYDKVLNDYRLTYSPLIPVRKNGRWGFIDFTGKEIVPTIYDRVEIEQQHDQYNPVPWRGQVELNGEWWRIDETGKRLEDN